VDYIIESVDEDAKRDIFSLTIIVNLELVTRLTLFYLIMWKIIPVSSCHVKSEFEPTTDLGALHSQMA